MDEQPNPYQSPKVVGERRAKLGPRGPLLGRIFHGVVLAGLFGTGGLMTLPGLFYLIVGGGIRAVELLGGPIGHTDTGLTIGELIIVWGVICLATGVPLLVIYRRVKKRLPSGYFFGPGDTPQTRDKVTTSAR